MTMFDDAVRAVQGGRPPAEAAAELYAVLTEDERLWLLDGDTECWEGLARFRTDGLQHRADRPRRSRAARSARYSLRGRAPRLCGRPRHGLPGLHGPGRDLGRGPRRRGGRRDRAGDPRPRRQLLRRRVHQPAPPSGLGPGSGDLRRRPASPRGVRSRAHPRHPALGHGLRQALRARTPWRTLASSST